MRRQIKVKMKLFEINLIDLSKSHLITISISIQWLLSGQHSRRQHNAHQNEVSKVAVIAKLVTKYAKPTFLAVGKSD